MKIKKLITSTLIFITAFTNVCGALPYKQETVYVNLKATGEEENNTVSDWIYGIGGKDYVKDLSSLQEIKVIQGKKNYYENGLIRWDAGRDDIYYQGKSSKKTPLDIKIKYYLENKEISPEELAGKTGRIKIKINLKNLEKRFKMIGGKVTKIYVPFMAATVVSMPTDKFSDIKINHGHLLSDGNNQISVFVTSPGMNETLDQKNLKIDELKDLDIPDEFEIEAYATEFELNPIVVVLSNDLIDFKIKNTGSYDEYLNDIDRIIKDKDEYKRIDPEKTLEEIYTVPAKTVAAQLLISDIAEFHSLDKNLLDILPDYVTHENIALYKKVKKDIKDSDTDYILDNTVLRGIPERLTDENIDKTRILTQDYDEIKTVDMDKMDLAKDILDDYDDMKPFIDKGLSLLETAEDHEDEIDDLLTLADYGTDALNLIAAIKNSGLDSALTDEDIKVMLEALIKERAAKYAQTSVIDPATHKVKDEYKEKVIALLEEYKKNIQVTSPSAITVNTVGNLIQYVENGWPFEPTDPQGQAMLQLLNTIIPGAEAAGDVMGLASKVKGLLESVQSFDEKMRKEFGSSYSLKLMNAAEFSRDNAQDIRELRDLKREHDETIRKAKRLIKNENDMHYYQYWAGRGKEMKADMDDNEENIQILKDMLKEYEDPRVRNFKFMIPTLLTDMDEVRPIVESLNSILEEPLYDVSLNKSPETLTTLIKMKNDLEENKEITDTLTLAIRDDMVKTARDIIDIMDRYDKENKLPDVKTKIEDVNDLIEKKDALDEISKNYSIFSSADAQMDSGVQFIFKTSEITKPEEKETPEIIPEKQGFWDKLKNLFK